VGLAHDRPGIAGKHERILSVTRPGGERGVGISADGDEDYVVAVFEKLCVLITVRIHLDRSAFGARLVEEREDDGFPLVIAEPLPISPCPARRAGAAVGCCNSAAKS